MNLKRMALIFTFFALVTVGTPMFEASAKSRGIVGQKAPRLDGVQTWYGLKKGEKHIDMDRLRGKVVYLFFFQSWCPGCHSHGFPTMKKTYDAFSKRDDVVFIAVQTVFEGFGINSSDKAYKSVNTFGLPIPVGHDPGPAERGSVTMRRYRSGGTPWTVIIDKKGVVRFNGFRIDATKAKRWVTQLLADGT